VKREGQLVTLRRDAHSAPLVALSSTWHGSLRCPLRGTEKAACRACRPQALEASQAALSVPADRGSNSSKGQSKAECSLAAKSHTFLLVWVERFPHSESDWCIGSG
jgi:hypothetical protein